MKTREVAGKFKFWIRAETEMEIYRAESFFDKEPETIAWIDDFTSGVFADVGANIGIYSLYCAATHPDVVVLAFEPMLENFNRLLQNIEINGFHNIVPMRFAVGHTVKTANLYVPKTEAGSSGAQIDHPMNEHRDYFEPMDVQNVSQFPLDGWPGVNYLKIDVDGHEIDVLRGASATLSSPLFRSMLIECNKQCIDMTWLDAEMKGCALSPDDKFNRMANHSRNRRGNDPENVIFSR